MIKNLAITTPVLGTIRLGDVAINPQGKRYPVRSNHFKITALYKDKDGHWVEHPMQQEVAKATGQDPTKLTEIPVRFMFNNPELNMRARYEAFNKSGCVVCAGDGKSAKRLDGNKVVGVECPGAANCEFGKKANCDLFARLNVIIDGQDDDFSTFILRTESVNAVKTLYAKMQRMSALFGNRLIGIPFKLKLRQKATSMSMWTKFFYTDLVLNKVTPMEAMTLAQEHEKQLEASGLQQQAMEAEALAGLQNGAFEDTGEDFDELEAFLLARGSDEAPEEKNIDTGDAETGTEAEAPRSLSALRDWLTTATDAGVLDLPRPNLPSNLANSEMVSA